MCTELNRIETERVGAAPFEERAVMMVSDGYLIEVGQNDHDRGSFGALPAISAEDCLFAALGFDPVTNR